MDKKWIYDMAQLSEASYAELVGAFDANRLISALGNRDFSHTQASLFAADWQMLNHQPNTASGFSASLFENIITGEKVLAIRGSDDAFDGLTDAVDIGLLGTVKLQSQYQDLQNYYQELISTGLLSPTETFRVTGHSLGGFLAQSFTVDYADTVTETYTFNAPGIGGIVAEVLEAVGVAESQIDVSKITNIVAQAGSAFVAGLGTFLGTQQPVFIEEQSGVFGSIANHSIKLLSDSLSVYRLLGTLNPALTPVSITPILEAAANQPEESLETIVASIGDILDIADSTDPDPRERLYQEIEGIQSALDSHTGLGLASLVGFDDYTSIAVAARSDLGFLYALEELNPFAIVGDNALYSNLEPNNFSDEYLKDRARLLDDKLTRNIHDDISSVDHGPDPRGPLHFVDRDSGYEMNILPGAPGLKIEFGSDKAGPEGDDVLMGTTVSDHLYGRVGNDTLDGNGGSDYLEGGIGDDTYIVYSGLNDVAVIHDADGMGRLQVADGSTLGGQIDSKNGAANHYEDGDKNTYLITGSDLHITLAAGGEIFVKNFTDGMLGMSLNSTQSPAEPVIPAGTPVWQQGPGPTDQEQIAPSVFDPQKTLTPEIILAQVRGLAGPVFDTTAPGQIAGSVWGGLGDSEILGDDGFNYIVDDMQTTAHFVNGDPGAFDWLLNDPVWDARLRTQLTYFWLGDRAGNDVLHGGGGNDWLISHGGDDWLYGEDGDDFLYDLPALDFGDGRWLAQPGATSDDHLFGGAGQDLLITEQGDDYLDGGDGDDILLSGQGDDDLTGGLGSDWLLADAAINRQEFVQQPDGSYARIIEAADAAVNYGKDTLFGDEGNDTLAGGGGADWLQGGANDDTLWGDGTSTIADTGAIQIAAGDGAIAGDDHLFGEQGNDSLIGGGGRDYLDGGAGDDVLQGDHVDLASNYHGDDALYGGSGNDLLLGGGGNDDLSGEGGNDQLQGDEGDDNLFGGDDLDVLSGGTGHDLLSGEAGDDQLFGNNGDDGLFGGSGTDHLDGGDGKDVLIGEAGDDELFGAVGNDILEGGSGNDLLFGWEGDDVYFLNIGDGEDVIIDPEGIDAIAFGEGIDQNSVTLTQFQANDGAHYLYIDYGNAGDQVLVKNGPLGTIRTFGFADGTTLDFVDLMAQHGLPVNGQGTPGADVIVGGASADQLDGGAGNDELHGGDQDDRLLGGSGDDILEGDAGDDVLDGGAGNDVLRGGLGLDAYRIAWGMGQDIVEESGAETSVLRLDPGIALADLVIRHDQNDLVVQLKGVDESVRIKDYALTTQPWEVQTDDGVTTPIDGLIDDTTTGGVTDAVAAIDRYETGIRALFHSTLGAQGRVLGADGNLHGSRASASSFGATTEFFTDEFSIVDQVADDPVMGRVSTPFVKTATRVQELISVASLDAVVGQASLGSGGGTFQQPNVVGTSLPAGATIVNVFGRPQDLDGNTNSGIGGYTQPRGFWVYGSGAGIAPPSNLQYQQVTHNIDQIDSQVTLERIIAGSSDNEIATRAHSVVDAGAGDDTVSARFPFLERWDWRYFDKFEVNPYQYDCPYDTRNQGALLYGNSGNDSLEGSDAGDTLIGGEGNDYADGRHGGDIYLALAGDTGVDIIIDSGDLPDDPETFVTRYQDWYYQSLGIPGWDYRDAGLPPLPQVALNDYATIGTLAAEGVIETDTVEFGEGIALSDLTLSWGEYVPQASDGYDPDLPLFSRGPWVDSGSVHTTLDITWAVGQGVRVVIPHSEPMHNGVEEEVLDYAPFLDISRYDWFLGTGIEQFKFADGTLLSMQDMLALTPPAPSFDPHEQDNEINGTDDSESLIGWTGDDTLRGGGGNDIYRFKLGDGIDTIEDTLLPGESNVIAFAPGIFIDDLNVVRIGSDITIEVGTGGDAIVLKNPDSATGDGANVIEYLYFAHEDEVLLADLLPSGVPGEQITGTSGYDTLAGGAGDDVIDGLAGNDTIDGNEGNDIIIGGTGRDTLNGGVGDDTFILEGTDNKFDTFNGDAGVDTILGGAGDDTIRLRRFDATHSVEVIDGGAGMNVIAGTGGYDTIDLSATTVLNMDHLDAGAGNDTVTGTDQADIIIGGAGRDTLNGGAGDDTFIIQGADNKFDTFNGDAGVDTILGGAGDDTIRLRRFDPTHSIEVIDGGAGMNVIAGTGGYDTIDLSATTVLNMDHLDAGAGNDTVTGTDQADIIIGGAGRDTLNGGAGDDTFIIEGTDSKFDTFNGGAGVDTILGGTGDDTIRLRSFDASNNVEVIDGGAGINVIAGTGGYDTIDLSATTVLNLDHLDAGAGNDTVTGTDQADIIIGGTGRDTLNGGTGDDTYHFVRGDGRDHLLDLDTTSNTDKLDFAPGIDHDQLWFSQLNNDLRVQVIGTSDEVLINNWYLGSEHQIEQLHSGDGLVLLNTQVEQLVQAMSGFQPPASGELEFPAAYEVGLEPVISVNWQAA